MSVDLDEHIALSIQRLFRNTPLLLVGSGFSCGYGLPSMPELGQHLTSKLEDILTSSDAIRLWSEALPRITEDLEDGLNAIAMGAPGREEVIRAVREETGRLIISRTLIAEKLIISSPNPALHAPERLLKLLFRGAPQNADCISVITTNYDTLIELFSDLSELPIDTGFVGFRHRRLRSGPLFQAQYKRVVASGQKGASYHYPACPCVRLIKPHGSINWQVINGIPTEILDSYSDNPNAIVIPGPSKYEDALVNTLFDRMRSEMVNAVNRASALCCIGFGFNDKHLQGVIHDRLEAGMSAIIITRDFTENIRRAVQQHPHIIAIQRSNEGAEVHYNGSVHKVPDPRWQLHTFLNVYLE